MKNITTKKIDKFTIEITKAAPVPEPIKTTYERSFIENQINVITQDIILYTERRNKEIAECEQILAEMDKHNIVAKEEEITN